MNDAKRSDIEEPLKVGGRIVDGRSGFDALGHNHQACETVDALCNGSVDSVRGVSFENLKIFFALLSDVFRSRNLPRCDF